MEPRGSAPDNDEDFIGSSTTAGEIIGVLAKRGCSDLTLLIDLGACSDLPRGGGGFCDIYRGSLRGGTRIAIKSLRIYEGSETEGDTERRKILKRAARELYHWSKLQHRNVLPLLGLATFRGQISMLSEWMDNGNLVSFLRLNPDADRNRLCMDVCEGLCHIHMNGMVHGDLKAANVVVSPHGTAMIADFGNAQLNDLTLKFTNTTNGGFSVRWAAPELLLADGGPQVTKEADVYAYGMTVLEALTGKVPYEGISDNRIFILVAVEKKVPSRPNVDMSDDLWGLLNWCWAREPPERPEITRVRGSLTALFSSSSDTGSVEGSASHFTSPSSEHKPEALSIVGNARSPPRVGEGTTSGEPQESSRNLGASGIPPLESSPQFPKGLPTEPSASPGSSNVHPTYPPSSLPASRSNLNPDHSWRLPAPTRDSRHESAILAPVVGNPESYYSSLNSAGQPSPYPIKTEGESSESSDDDDHAPSMTSMNTHVGPASIQTASSTRPPRTTPRPLSPVPRPHPPQLQQPRRSAVPHPSHQLPPPPPPMAKMAQADSQQTTTTTSPPRLTTFDLGTAIITVPLSHIRAKDRGNEVLSFVIEITLDPLTEREGWKIEKLYSDVLALDVKVRQTLGRSALKKIAPLPDAKLFKDNAPVKVDQRKVMLQAYLRSVLWAPWKNPAGMIAFFTSDVIIHARTLVSHPGYKEGYLTKRGRKFGGWKTRYFVLQSPVLEYYESRGGEHLGSISLAGSQIGRQQRTPGPSRDNDENAYRHAFLIVEGKRGPSGALNRHVLCAESDEERDSWVEVLVRYVVGGYDKHADEAHTQSQPQSYEQLQQAPSRASTSSSKDPPR